jgi:multiple sugar transport system ATP-binding protein
MAKIVLDHVSKVFGDDVVAVDDVSLEIGDGEFIVLVGPSGCGKSTILRILAGLEEVTAGELFLDEREITDLPPKDRDIAMVFQNYALYPHMTVEQNLGFGLKLRRTPKDEQRRRVDDVAKVLGLDKLMQRKPSELSGGQRQRVAMGRAMVREPHAFLMDEPLSNLDAKLRVQMRTEVSRIQSRLGTTTVYVTHDQTEAMTLGDRVAVMRSGVLQQVGSPGELYGNPKNLFVAGFIGSPAMNFMPATIDGDIVKLPIGDVRIPDEVRQRVESRDGARDSVIVGIRPESFEDASLLGGETRDRGAIFKTKIDLVESLGAEDYVYFQVESGALESDQLQELAEDAGAHEVPSSGEGQVVARVDAASELKRGAEAELWLDTSKLHFFDPSTGQSLTAS